MCTALVNRLDRLVGWIGCIGGRLDWWLVGLAVGWIGGRLDWWFVGGSSLRPPEPVKPNHAKSEKGEKNNGFLAKK